MTILPSIYIQDKYINGGAPERIANLWAQVIRLGDDDPQAIERFEALGVHRTDAAARRILLPLMQRACGKEIQIKPDENEGESGVYFLSEAGQEPFAVFKVGSKRAYGEAAARQIAHTMGLAKHAIPVAFCAMAHPTFPKGGATIEELWNGNQKVFPADPKGDYREQILKENAGLETPPTLTGVFEPYLSSAGKREASVGDFASMTTLAVALGMRDAKPDGMSATPLPGEERGPVLFDNEDCMPPRVLPDGSPNRFVAALHMPFLKDPLSEQEIPPATREELRQKVNAYADQLEEGLAALRSQTIAFADLPSESRFSIEDVVQLMDRMRGLAHNTHSLARISDASWASLSKKLKEIPHKKEILEMIHHIRHADKHRSDKLFPLLDQFCRKFSRENEDEPFARLLSSWDQGGCPVTIEKTRQILETPPKQVKEGTPLFSEDQLKAFALRVLGLRDFFAKDTGNSRDMVGAVDPLYREHLKSTHSVDVVGVMRPKDIGSLDAKAVERIHLSPTAIRTKGFFFRQPGLQMRERPLPDQEGGGIELGRLQNLFKRAQPVGLGVESRTAESV